MIIQEPLQKCFPELNSMQICALREEFRRVERSARLDELLKADIFQKDSLYGTTIRWQEYTKHRFSALQSPAGGLR